MSVLRWLNKPHYIFRPAQVLRRFRAGSRTGHDPLVTEARLPWGLSISFDRDDLLGSAIARMGVYDLCVCEAIHRLLDVGELAVDVGANIGVMTSLMARRVGPTGRVVAFEPHPEIVEQLRANVNRWKPNTAVAPIDVHALALSDRSQTMRLFTDTQFDRNKGTASLVPTAAPAASTRIVSACRLDDVVSDTSVIGMLKIDVEGHEFEVLRGAERLLKDHRVRDVIFEEMERPPTPATRLLESLGYTVLALQQRLFGVVVSPLGKRDPPLWDPPSYLATIERDRAVSRLRPRGWAVLRRPPRG